MGPMIVSVCYCILLSAIIFTAKAEEAVVFKTLENDLLLAAESALSLGHASDVFTDIQCLVPDGDDTAGPRRQWQIQPEDHPLPSPLNSSHTSFNRQDGVLRVFSQFVRNRARDGVLMLQCLTANNRTANLQLTIYPTVFFMEDLPSETASLGDVLSLCANSLPSLPAYSLALHSGTSEGGTNYSYCTVNTARGRFRSRSVVTGGTDRFSVLNFERGFPAEVVEWASSDSDAIRLPCQIGGATTVGNSFLVFFLRDGQRVSPSAGSEDGVYIRETNSMSRQTLMIEKWRGNEGVYQCVGQAGEDSSTSVISSTYVNIHYLEEPTISLSGDSAQWRPDSVIILGQPDTPREVVLNCSVDAHPIPTFSWTRQDEQTLTEVEGRQGRSGYRERAFSELRLLMSQLKADMEFTCMAAIGDRRKNVSISITAYSHVEFTEQPRVLASSGRPLLSCAATSIPIAEITWFQVENGTARELTSNDEGISIEEVVDDDNCTVRSTLQLAPITDLSVTGYYCKGDNGFFYTSSNTLNLLQSAPAPPEVRVSALSPHSVAVDWTLPISLLALSHYTVTLYHISSTEGDRELLTALHSTTQPAGLETALVFENLRPFSSYAVKVEAQNIANNSISSGLKRVKTPETAPEGAPENIVAEAKDTDKIRLSWSPPNASLRNGVIRWYSIFYHPTTDPAHSSILNNISGSEAVLELPQGAGVSYTIRVAAFTVGRGPFSEGVVQMTYPLPPSFSSGPPIIAPGVKMTENTIPVQLPLVNTSQFSHFWVVAVRVDESMTPQSEISQNTTIPAPPSTDGVPLANTPYVVAEMSADSYRENHKLFVIGDESKTRELNDFPDLYRNFPLLAGSVYTVFVRGFPPSIPPSEVQGNTRTRKQAEVTERQYTVFSSSEFLPTTATLSAEGDTGPGQLEILVFAAIGVGGSLILLVVIIILVVRKKLRAMGRRHTGPADDMKFGGERLSSQRRQAQSSGGSNDGTLPRGLTVTGEGIKHEEHIYEDPLYLKAREAFCDSEPTYKVPRPVSLDQDSTRPSDEVGYEIITPATKPRPMPRGQKSAKNNTKQESLGQLGQWSAPAKFTEGYYELMKHPSSLGKGGSSNLSLPTSSPTPYLSPVGVSDTQRISAGYSLLTTSGASGGDDGRGYVNLPRPSPGDAETSFVTRETATPPQPDYVVMKSVTPQH